MGQHSGAQLVCLHSELVLTFSHRFFITERQFLSLDVKFLFHLPQLQTHKSLVNFFSVVILVTKISVLMNKFAPPPRFGGPAVARERELLVTAAIF